MTPMKVMPRPTLSFSRLVELQQKSERLNVELHTLGDRIADAVRDLATKPGANPVLIGAHMLRLRGRQSEARAELREVTEEARELLGRDVPVPEIEPWPADSPN